MFSATNMFLRAIVAFLYAAAAFGDRGAADHDNDKCSRAWSYVSAAELFYLRHLRSCAACANGCSSTSSVRSLCLVSGWLGWCFRALSGLMWMCGFAAYWCFRALSGLMWMFVFALSHLAPLELGACILIGSSVSTVWRSWLALGACSALALGLAAAGRRCCLWLVVSCIVRTASMLSQHCCQREKIYEQMSLTDLNIHTFPDIIYIFPYSLDVDISSYIFLDNVTHTYRIVRLICS